MDYNKKESCDNEKISANNESDIVMPVVALRAMVMFPSMILHFDVGRRRSILALESALKTNQNVFIVSQKDIETDEPNINDIYQVGIIAKVKEITRQHGSGFRALVEGVRRGIIAGLEETIPFMRARVHFINELMEKESLENVALERKSKELFLEYLTISPRVSPDLLVAAHSIDGLGPTADFIASNVAFAYEDKQKVLEELNDKHRLELVVAMLSKELEILKMENKLAGQLRKKMDQKQREYLLREQMKVISEELGDSDDPDFESKKYLIYQK